MYQVLENGISYAISMEGQKTGFYADQRENRQFISTISNKQKVLDLCCYSGGFSLNACRGGASHVTCTWHLKLIIIKLLQVRFSLCCLLIS